MNLFIYEVLYFFIIITIVVYIILGGRHIYNKDYRDFRIENLYYDNIDTGDIFLVSYSNVLGVLNHAFLSLKFIHTAICVKDDSNLYILEFANYFNKYIGFMKMPFSKWINLNKNHLILVNKMKIVSELPNERKEIAKKFLNYYEENKTEIDLDFMMFMYKHLTPSNKYTKFDPKRTDYACYEILSSMLKETGILHSLKSTESYRTDDFIGMNGFDLNPQYSYDNFFIADISGLKFISD